MDPHVCAAWCVPLSLRLPKICMTAAPRPRACVQSGERKTQEAPTEPCEKPHQAEILLNNVHLAFNKKPVLSGVNLKIWPGEATAIIGTSGTG